MEKHKNLTRIVRLIAGILALEIAFLVYLVRPSGFFLWTTIGVIALMCLYLVVISLTLLKKQAGEDHPNRSTSS